MKWAIKNEERILATTKDTAICPLCNEEVIAKCGEIKVWHWAHKNNFDCDNWYEPETEWHLNWKNKFPKEQQEFVIGKHIADIRTSNRYIIELQNSSISSKEITKRENYYKRMIWLLNAEKLAKGLKFRKIKEDIITFRWKHPPKSWWFAKKEIYIDLNIIPIEGNLPTNIKNLTKKQKKFWIDFLDKIFLIKKIYHNLPCGGWGTLISKEDFLKKFRG